MIYASAVRRIIQSSASIEYVGGKIDTSPSAFDTTGLTGGIGAQAEAGDFILIYCFNPVSIAAVSGFTQVIDRAQTTATRRTYISADYRVALAAGESFTSGSSSLAMMVFRGVGGVESSDSSAGTGNSIKPPAVTPVAPGAIIVAGGASNNSTATNSPPAGALYSVVYATTTGADIGMCVGTTDAWSAGTSPSSGSSHCSISIVLAPA